MLLKRKRSESELSLSSSSGLSSPSKHDITAMDTIAASRVATAPPHLPSRTMKRFRDSRPSDQEVHQRTLNMLFTAQKQHQQHEHEHGQRPSVFAFAQAPPMAAAAAAAHPQSAQVSLHKFWNLPTPTPLPGGGAASPPVDSSIYAPASCEDCGQGLGGAGGDDAMEVDSFDVGVETACSACGKHVCSHCSITNLGEQRRCLICAGRKIWVGGLGWTSGVGVPVC